MVLNNINNLIIITESVLDDVAGNALLTGVKHGVKQFGRGLTDIVHLGKFKALKDAADDRDKAAAQHAADWLGISKRYKESDKLREIARARENEIYQAKGNITPRKKYKLKSSINRTYKRAAEESEAAKSAHQDLTNRRDAAMTRYNDRVDPLRNQLNLTDDLGGKLARIAGRTTAAGIAGAATSGIGADTNKEESK